MIVSISLSDDAKDLGIPEYKTEGASGVDLRANVKDSVVLKRFERMAISTGLSIELGKGYEAQVRPRSGLAIKHGITVLNTPGTVDNDYRGEIKVILINLGEEDFKIERGDRIAQLVIASVEQVEFKEVESLTESERGSNGFGSTGVKE